jgi:hypothetical protein
MLHIIRLLGVRVVESKLNHQIVSRKTFLSGAACAALLTRPQLARAGTPPILPCDAAPLIDPRFYLNMTDGVISNRQYSTLQQTFSELERRYHEEHLRTLAVFIHGGLVDASSGLCTAHNLKQPLLDAGAFPYFFIYNVGPADSVQKGSRDNDARYHIPNPQWGGLINRYNQEWRDKIARDKLKRDHGEVTMAEAQMRDGILASNVGLRGSEAWAYMKGTIDDALQIDRYTRVTSPQRAGGVEFLNALDNFLSTRRDFRVALIGHSTGSIYISKMLRKVDEILTHGAAAKQQFEVIFLAPAVSYSEFYRTLLESPARLGRLRIFTMSDTFEMKDPVLASTLGAALAPIAKVYDRSLLYLISGVFEGYADEPLLGLDRFRRIDPASGFEKAPLGDEQLKRVNYVLSAIQRYSPWVLSRTGPTAARGYRSQAVDHGAFPSDYETLDSMTYLVANNAHWDDPPTQRSEDLSS